MQATEKEQEARMVSGRVKRVLVEKGYGFVSGDDGVDYFMAYCEVRGARLEDLRVGEAVTFDRVNSDRGPRAANVTTVSSSDMKGIR